MVLSWILLYLVQSGAPFSLLCPDHLTPRTGQASLFVRALAMLSHGASPRHWLRRRLKCSKMPGSGLRDKGRHMLRGAYRPSAGTPYAAATPWGRPPTHGVPQALPKRPSRPLRRPSAAPQAARAGRGPAAAAPLPRAAPAGSAAVSGGDGALLHR